MKVAIVVHEFPTLSETFVLNITVGLLERGHEVHIFAEKKGTSLVQHPLVAAHRLLARTTYLARMPGPRATRLRSALSLLNRHRPAFRDVAASLNVRKHGRAAASLRLLHEAVSLSGKGPFDVYHCQFGTVALNWLPLFDTRFLEGRLVVSFRGRDVSKYDAAGYRRLFARGDLFLPNCSFFRDRLVQLGCDPSRVIVYRSGIDCERFPFAPRSPGMDGKIRIATVGRLVEKKGIEYGLRAVARVASTYPQLEYHIVGDGPLKGALQQLAHDLGLDRVVTFHGWKPQDELVALLGDCHVFMAPSVTAADGNQDAPINVLKEAMAMGLPVVATRHGGIPELVEHGVSGYLVGERDVDALAQATSALLRKPHLWPSMGVAGRSFVERHYDQQRLSDELIDLYRRVLSGASSPSTQALRGRADE